MSNEQNLKPFAPGESGNPGGRPKWKPWSDAYRKIGILTLPALQILPTDSVIECSVKKMYLQAIGGSVRAAREIADRTDGRVPLPLIGSTDEPLAITIVSGIPRPDRKQAPAVKVAVKGKKKHARNVN